MRRFHFSLERLLKLKQQRERQAELRQQQARAALDTARAERARIEGELARGAADAEARLRASIALGVWQARYDQVAALGAMLEVAWQQVGAAERKLEEANRQRVEIAVEVETLLSLRERQWREHRAEEARRRQAALDEVVLQRWQAAREGRPGGAGAGPEESSR